MNTVEAIMISQLPIAVVGFLLWLEIRKITGFLTASPKGHDSDISTEKYSVHSSSKDHLIVTEE